MTSDLIVASVVALFIVGFASFAYRFLRRNKRQEPKLVHALSKMRVGFVGRLAQSRHLEEVEEILLSADIGVKTTAKLLAIVKESFDGQVDNDAGLERCQFLLSKAILEILLKTQSPHLSRPSSTKPVVVMFVGVNGVGKTTTIGKISAELVEQGNIVVVGAGDTFRAAASEQLEIWAKRSGAEIVRGKEGADPSSVLFDAVSKAKQIGAAYVLCDTAGRLHTKVNLMDELKKVYRVLSKACDGAPHEILLVLDATTGQNAIEQARQFQAAAPLTGIVLTKLDGTAKGGIVVAISDELGIPIRYIGVGEGIKELRPFDAHEFVGALFQKDA